jgi:predicted DNA-binding transcriptional regulator AlpA
MQQQNKELASTLPQALSSFDQMPNSSYVRLPIVRALYGVSTATIWRNCSKGLMPSPVKLSQRCTAWNVGLIRADLASKGVQ